MKKTIKIMLVAFLFMTMAACSSKEIKNSEEWDALFSNEKMKNVTMSVDVHEAVYLFERDGNKLHIAYDDDMEYFVEEVDGVVTYYYIDGDDVVGESAGTSTSIDEIFTQEGILDVYQGIFSTLTYDKSAGVYIEENNGITNTYKVNGGKINEVIIDSTGEAYKVSFDKYGKTKVSIPEMTMSYAGDDSEGDVTVDEWNFAFTPENFKNVTAEHYFEYGDGTTFYSITKYAEDGFEYDEETGDGEYDINFFYRNDDGSYSFINNETSGTLSKEEVEDTFLTDVVATETLGIPTLRSLYTYDSEYGGWIYSDGNEVTFVGFSNGKLAVIMTGNSDDMYQIYFSNYGSTRVGEFGE